MTRSATTAPAGQETASPRTEAMAKGRQADSARRRQRVIAVLNHASSDGAEISVSGIARAAAVDRTFLYRHRVRARNPRASRRLGVPQLPGRPPRPLQAAQDCGSNGVSGPITPGLTAWRERCRDDRDTGRCDEEEQAGAEAARRTIKI
jgi:hypothetical protein